MRTLSQLKKDLEFNKSLSSLIEVLKNLAVAQYKILEQKIKSFKELDSAVLSFFELIDIDSIKHPFLKPSDNPKIIIAITSDTGLLGGLNMQIVNIAISNLKKEDKLIVIGERGKLYASDFGVKFVSFSGIIDEERFSQAMQLRDYVFSQMRKENFSSIKVVYPHPVSFTVQKVMDVWLLPFSFLKDIKKEKKFKEIIYESSIDDILKYLAYIWVGKELYDIFGLSRLAEFAARYIHLEESLQKLKEMNEKTRLQYFKVRHEIIDKNMRELFSSRILFG